MRSRERVMRSRGLVIVAVELVAFLGLWQLAVAQFHLVNRIFFPAPSDILTSLLSGGELVAQLGTSATSWAAGFGAGALAGVATGMLAGTLPWANRLIMPILWSLWATPLIALQPTLTAWLDYGSGPIVVLVFLSTMIPVALNTATGAALVPQSLLRAGHVYGGNVYLRIRVPWSVPYMIGGLRLAVPTSLIGLLVGEMVGAPSGLGSVIVNATSRFRTGEAFAAIGVYVVISVVLVRLLDVAERRVGRWRTGD